MMISGRKIEPPSSHNESCLREGAPPGAFQAHCFKDIANDARASIGNAKPSRVNAAALRTRKAQTATSTRVNNGRSPPTNGISRPWTKRLILTNRTCAKALWLFSMVDRPTRHFWRSSLRAGSTPPGCPLWSSSAARPALRHFRRQKSRRPIRGRPGWRSSRI